MKKKARNKQGEAGGGDGVIAVWIDTLYFLMFECMIRGRVNIVNLGACMDMCVLAWVDVCPV